MDPQRLPELLAYRSTQFEQRMQRAGTVSSCEEAALLLHEVKKYLWLTELHPELALPMHSQRVDDAWHGFLCLTEEYATFCQRFFGKFAHHFPDTAPELEQPARPRLDFAAFREKYEAVFGSLSPLWQDELALAGGTRLARSELPGPLEVRSATAGQRAELVYGDITLLRVSKVGRPALEFIARHDHFYVRELPGLSSEQAAGLCQPLVRCGLLQVMP